jgi:hypothetical protein
VLEEVQRVSRKLSIGAAAVALVALFGAVAPTVSAKGKPNGGSTTGSSLSLVPLDSTDGEVHYQQQVTFDVSTTVTAYPQVRVDCMQSGVQVYSASAGFYPSYPWPWERNFTLASSWWTGGAADCNAELYYWNGRRFTTLAAMSFHVYA